MHKTALLTAIFIITLSPISAFAYVDLGAYYFTPAPHSQPYYQPLYAYSSYGAAAPTVHGPNTYVNQPTYQYQPYMNYNTPLYNYGYQPYNTYQQYSYQPYSYYQAPQYYQYQPSYYNYGYAPYGQGVNMYGQNVPYSYGYPTGETVPLIGGELCEFPDYNGRALCGSNPNQYIYDPWTGSWY